VDLKSLSLTDPMVLKAGGGVALFALGGSRAARMLGLALVGWAAWDYLKAPPAKPAPKLIPYDPDAPLPLEQAATSSPAPAADPFTGTKWEGGRYTPSVRPRRPGDPEPGGKVIPLRPPTAEERAMFYGINPEPGDNVG
jgi:hypothetical protein